MFYFLYLKGKLLHIGKNSYLSPKSIYRFPERIHVGNNVYVGPRAIISASQGIHLGNGVTIGPELMVMGGDHNFQQVGSQIWQTKTGGTNKKITIEDDVWIGARVTILKGVNILEGAVVGAGSVVTKDLCPYCIYAGNPTKKLRPRFSQDELRRHIEQVPTKYRWDDLKYIFD